MVRSLFHSMHTSLIPLASSLSCVNQGYAEESKRIRWFTRTRKKCTPQYLMELHGHCNRNIHKVQREHRGDSEVWGNQALRRSALTNERWVDFSTQRQGEWWGRINMPSNSSMTWVSLTTSGTQMVCDGESPQSSPWLFLEALLHSTSIYIGHYLSVLSLC